MHFFISICIYRIVIEKVVQTITFYASYVFYIECVIWFLRKLKWFQVGPDKWFMPAKYRDHAASIYNIELRPDDIWVVTFPRSGTRRSRGYRYENYKGCSNLHSSMVRAPDFGLRSPRGSKTEHGGFFTTWERCLSTR
jgi:hypothetical protein